MQIINRTGMITRNFQFFLLSRNLGRLDGTRWGILYFIVFKERKNIPSVWNIHQNMRVQNYIEVNNV
jgi:hypothetical protein